MRLFFILSAFQRFIIANEHPYLQAKSYDFKISTYDVSGGIIEENTIEFSPGFEFVTKINLGSRDEHLVGIQAQSEFYAYDCEFGL
jgi:hypothetical protein